MQKLVLRGRWLPICTARFISTCSAISTVPQALALAAENAPVEIVTEEPDAWSYPLAAAKALGWGEKRVILLTP